MRDVAFTALGSVPRSLSMSETVTRDLRQAILDGSLPPGQEFMLRETARRFGVSTAPVRDAIRILQSEGLVQVRRARSAVVAPMDAADLESIYSLRRRIEPELASRASTTLSDETLNQLAHDAVACDSRETPDLWERHRAFHEVLYGAAATSWEMRVVHLLAHAAERYFRVAHARNLSPADCGAAPLSHQWLVTQLRSRDAKQVFEAFTRHLEASQACAARALP